MDDEEWTANLPEHHLKGYVAVDDDIEQDDGAEEGSGDDDEEEDLVGVHDDDVYADEDAAADADNEDEDADANDDEDDNADAGSEGEGDEDDESLEKKESIANSLVQKGKKKADSGHLHKTSIRVDPPLTSDGKKSIEEAEK